MSSYRSINQAVLISQVRWPDLHRAIVRSTDGWLYYLEDLMASRQARLDWAHYLELGRFLIPFGIRPSRSVQTALDRVFMAQGVFCAGDDSEGDGESGGSGPGGGATADETHGDGIEGPAVRYGVG